MIRTPIDLPEVKGPAQQPTVAGVKEGLAEVIALFGPEVAAWVERIWRKETGHFRFGFRQTCGAGMHPWARRFPWGWRDIRPLWEREPGTRPGGYVLLREAGTGKRLPYLVFPEPRAFALSLAYLLHTRAKRHDWNMERAAGSWFSRVPWRARKYARDAARITPTITLSMTRGRT